MHAGFNAYGGTLRRRARGQREFRKMIGSSSFFFYITAYASVIFFVIVLGNDAKFIDSFLFQPSYALLTRNEWVILRVHSNSAHQLLFPRKN